MSGISGLIDTITPMLALPEPAYGKNCRSLGAQYYTMAIWFARFLACCGAVGCCLFLLVGTTNDNSLSAEDLLRWLWAVAIAPLLAGFTCYEAAMVLALLVAPEGFFSSAIGKRLLNIVGVKSGTTARSVCLFLTIVFWGIPIWVAVHMLG
jgi:hypothetical protein